MPNDIIVKFKPEGNRALVRAIEELQIATEKYGGTIPRVNKSAKKLTAQLKAQNLSWKKLGVSSKTLQQAYRGNATAIERMRVAMKKAVGVGNGMLRNNRLLHGSFATLRSQLLLVNFAMAMGVRQIIKFGQEAAKLQQMERAFTTLSGGAENASVAIDKLGKATNGTMSDFDLFQQANNAMILGVSKNSDEMAEMFDMAQRLGVALGKDTKSSVESLITGIGRQSRLMLDNIGIIVKADKAYSDYAVELGKTADTLTDSEKKQAFMNATLEAAREKVGRLPEEVLTADQKFQQFGASIDNLQVSIGTAFLPLLESMATTLTKVADAFDSDRVQAYATVIGVGLFIGMIAYVAQLKKAVIWQTRLGWGAMATAAGFLASELLVLSGVFNDSEKPLKEVSSATDTYLESLKTMGLEKLNDELAIQEEKLKNLPEPVKAVKTEMKNLRMKELTEDLKKTNGQFGFVTKTLSGTELAFSDVSLQVQDTIKQVVKMKDEGTWVDTAAIDLSIAKLKEYKDVVNAGFEDYDDYLDQLDLADQLYLKTNESQKAAIQNNLDEIDSLIALSIAQSDLGVANERYLAIRDMLSKQLQDIIDKENKLEQATFNARLDMYSASAKALSDLVGMNEDNAKAAAGIQAAAAIVDAYAAALSAMAQTAKYLPPPAPTIAFAATLATGLVAARQIAMSANAIGGGGGGDRFSTPDFEHGGYVGGRRHSQGGTLIEAEQGEFVMSRNAVESIGIEALNRMNLEGGGGGVNITVTGNVLTQDFVEGELAESIKEALRRGSDFGIS